jgi:hypothetical protein
MKKIGVQDRVLLSRGHSRRAYRSVSRLLASACPAEFERGSTAAEHAG